MDLQAVLSEIKSWPMEDRIQLIEKVWDGLDQADERIPFSEEQLIELQRRMDANRANPDAGSSWEDVKARLLSKKS
jgi:putative addiction module component (TIGR02574 family)